VSLFRALRLSMPADTAPPREALVAKLFELKTDDAPEPVKDASCDDAKATTPTETDSVSKGSRPSSPDLALSSFSDPDCATAKRIDDALVSAGACKAQSWIRVPSNYYDEDLEFRSRCVQAPSVAHMCKTLVMENTKCTETSCDDPNNSRWYLVVVQYTARLSQQKLEKYLHALNTVSLHRKIGKSKFHARLAKSEDSERLTGYPRGAVCPFGTAERVPVLVSDKIKSLPGGVVWLGGGETDLKIGVRVDDLVKGGFHAKVVDCTYDDADADAAERAK